MNPSYPYLSECLRTPYWSMHAGYLDFYRSEILKAVSGHHVDMKSLEENREHPSILVFRNGNVDFEERLILTSNTQWWDEEYLKKNDQIINVIPLQGPILSGGGPCTYGTAELADRFTYADSKPSVIGHFVIINTPGGSAMANDLNTLFEKSKKPVVALIRSMCCSKGVEIASHIPHVFAESPNAEIGCIGTIGSVYGQKSGTVSDGVVSYTVYSEDSPNKNLAYRQAIEEGNLEPLQKEVNDLNDLFVSNVKKRWPKCGNDKLDGITYKASEVEGELFDGYKTYSEAIDYIFELAGKERLQKGIVTPVGIISPSPSDDDDDDDYSNIKNTNPQTQLTPMANIQALEAILGEGTVQVDENDNVQLTADQIKKLDKHYASLNSAGTQSASLVSTQAQLIANQAAQLADKDKKINEMAQATNRGFAQEAPEGDNAVEQTGVQKVECAVDGVADFSERLKIVKKSAEQFGLLNN